VYTPPGRKYAIFDIAEGRLYSSECTKIVCRRAPPGPAGRAYSAPPDHLAAFDGPRLHVLLREGREGWGGEKRKRRKDAMHPLWKISGYAPEFLHRLLKTSGAYRALLSFPRSAFGGERLENAKVLLS